MSALQRLEEEYLTEDEVAKFLCITVASLRNRVSAAKDHPPKIKGLPKYPVAEFKKWLRDKQINQKAG